ncbi:hypothetical protein AB0D57_35010 [Streptomyces sp. NPDC048275]|uniref:hypothetical protein n=1 Tax=Streptomyces sp. NPDC048275 TaxID=3155629 RepID=UPI0033E43189
MSFLADAVEAIHAHWTELSGLLDTPAREELAEILADAESDPVAAASDVRDLVKPFTPPDHPLRQALAPPGVRFQLAPPMAQDNTDLLAALRVLHGDVTGLVPRALAFSAARAAGNTSDEPDTVPPYRPDADDAWILAEPSLPAASLVLPPDQIHDLILLTDEHDVERVPAFQLDPAFGAPYAVVVEINRLLSADVDPWGAADWWLGSNVWLDTAPARLLGTGVDHALLSAARAEIPEW